METTSRLILSVEIGGTNARFGEFAVSGTDTRQRVELANLATLPTADSLNCIDLFRQYASSRACGYAAVVVSAAGPVTAGHCTPPNIPWDIDLVRDLSVFGVPQSALLNDLAAQAHAIPLLLSGGKDARFDFSPALSVLNGAEPPAEAERFGMLSIGTGIGRAGVLRETSGAFCVLPSEAGHGCFPAVGPAEATMVRRRCEREGRDFLTWEDVLSGSGFPLTAAAFLDCELSNEDVRAMLTTNTQVGELFARLVARAVRSFAFDFLPTGGIFLAGGMLTNYQAALSGQTFREELHRTVKLPEIPQTVRVTVVDSDVLGLWGGVRALLSARGQ